MSAFTLPSASLLSQSVLSGIFVGALYGLMGLGPQPELGAAAPDQPRALRVRVPRRVPLLPARVARARSAADAGGDRAALLRASASALHWADGALRDHAVQLAAAHLRPHRHRRGADPVDLDRRLPQARVELRAAEVQARRALRAGARADHARPRGRARRSRCGRCCATPTSARRCAPRPRTRRSPRRSASTRRRNALLLAGTCAALASIAGVCLALSFTLAPSQIYAWIGVVFAAVMLGGLGRALGAARRRHR